MKNFAKSKGKRITAALLCAVMCIMSLPLSAFAFTAEEGKTVDAYYGDRYFGSDGDYYYDDYVMSQEQKIIVQRMADAMGVNYSPLITRLKELDLFDKRPIEEYLSTFRSGGELA